MEVWKDIPNYEGLYQASSLGRIRTCENKVTSNARYSTRVWKSRLIYLAILFALRLSLKLTSKNGIGKIVSNGGATVNFTKVEQVMVHVVMALCAIIVRIVHTAGLV